MIVLKLSLVSGRRTFFGRGNEIHYIGGTEILPAPLDTAEEQKMIHMLGTVNEETARSMLIERNLRLVVYIAKKFDNNGNRCGRSDFDWYDRSDQSDQYI